jgi:isopenicillin N synthase-like dioxygenase
MLRCLSQLTENGRTNLAGHTDITAITMVFNKLGGLQVLPRELENIDANWKYVRPKPGCSLVNLGDSMVAWTGGLLQSPLHRVRTAPGEQASYTRHSLAYLIRPEYGASMQRLRGGITPLLAQGEEEQALCVLDWEAMRAKQIMDGKNNPKAGK